MNRFRRSTVHFQEGPNLPATISSVVANPPFPRKIDVKCGFGTICAHDRSQSPWVPLDFWSGLADTFSSTHVPPLPLVGEAHLGRVLTRSTHSPCHSRLAVTHIKGEFLFFAPPKSSVEEHA